MEHSILSPSAAGCWSNCAYYIEAVRTFPSLDSNLEAAEEGTAAHEVAFKMAMSDDVSVGDVMSNGVYVTQDMLNGAELYLETIDDNMSVDTDVRLEEKMNIGSIHAECYGTPDCVMYRPGTYTVIDYKYGFRSVSPDSEQLICYAAGWVPLDTNENVKINLIVVQPRDFTGGKVKQYQMSIAELRSRVSLLKSSAERAMSAIYTKQATAGRHCADCPARFNCEASLEYGAYLYHRGYTPYFDADRGNTGTRLTFIKEAHEHLTNILEAAEMQADFELRSGKPVAGWTLRPGSAGRSQWSVGEDQIKSLEGMFNASLFKQTPLTPGQAIKAGVPAPVINAISEKSSPTMKLTKFNPNETFSHGKN